MQTLQSIPIKYFMNFEKVLALAKKMLSLATQAVIFQEFPFYTKYLQQLF